ncbi:MAG: hypothetical protein ACYTHM_11925 [Planctomycetota bacterium]|jgi:hypothetical protein
MRKRTLSPNELAAEPAPAVTYHFGGGMGLTTRLVVGGSLLALGTFLPFLFLPWVIGGGMILTGAFLLAPKGMTNTPPVRRGEGEWKEVSEEEIARIKNLARRSKAWGLFPLDGNTASGLLLLAGIAGATLLGAFLLVPDRWRFSPEFLWRSPSTHLPVIFVLDIALLALPLWFSGLKRRYAPTDLLLKIEALENILHRLEVFPVPDWRVKTLLEFFPCGKGSIPADARLNLAPESPPPDFIGIQIQVSLNQVQGTKYPYLYAVVLAREGFGLFDAERPHAVKEVFEQERSEDVDVIVVRQQTTKTSGYHTKAKDQIRVFETAFALAESALRTAV